LLLFIMN